jgi:hypothetical protein
MVQSNECRTAEQGTAEYRSKKYYLAALKTSAVSAGGGFDILRFKVGGAHM